MITLDETMFIGKGRVRRCYVHPEDKNLCIKVGNNQERAKRSIKREINYFKRLKKRGKSFDLISKYFYPVQTNEGVGEVYELVRDYNGDISKDLRYYLNFKEKELTSNMLELIEELRKYLIDEYIVF